MDFQKNISQKITLEVRKCDAKAALNELLEYFEKNNVYNENLFYIIINILHYSGVDYLNTEEYIEKANECFTTGTLREGRLAIRGLLEETIYGLGDEEYQKIYERFLNIEKAHKKKVTESLYAYSLKEGIN